MNDPVFLVGRRRGGETEAGIEALEISLGGKLDRLPRREGFQTPQRFGHQQAAGPGSPHLRRGDDATHRSFLIPDSRLEHARVGDQIARTVVVEPAEQVPGGGVTAIGIEIGAVLLDDEDALAQADDFVKMLGRKVAETRPLPPDWGACSGQDASVFSTVDGIGIT